METSNSRRAISLLCVFLFAGILWSSPALATDSGIPWCEVDPVGADGTPPFPRPYWSQFGGAAGVPDYENIMNNFNVVDSLTLIVSMLEKGIQSLEDTAAAPLGEAEGFCLCNCSETAEAWINFGDTTLKPLLDETLAALMSDFITPFMQEVQGIESQVSTSTTAIQNAVSNAVIAGLAIYDDADLESLLAIDDLAAGAAQAAADALEQELSGMFSELDALLSGEYAFAPQFGMAEVEAALAALMADVLSSVLSLDFDGAMDLLDDAVASVETTATQVVINGEWTVNQFAVAPNLSQIADEVELAVMIYLEGQLPGPEMENAVQDVMTQLGQTVVNQVSLVKSTIDSLFSVCSDMKAGIGALANGLVDQAVTGLQQIEGCYGKTTRSQCSTNGFCAGTAPGQVLGAIDVPVWFPTDIFKDGKSFVSFALEHIGVLEEVLDWVQEAAGDILSVAGGLMDALEDAADILADISNYVNKYTSGFHLGAYSQVRADLHTCVGYGGNHTRTNSVSFDLGPHSMGITAEFLSANLSTKHRAQFRSGGLSLFLDSYSLPLAPSISLSTQIDGFRMWNGNHPFGIGLGGGPNWGENYSFQSDDVSGIDAFALASSEQVGNLCPGGEGPCELTPGNLLVKSFYPIDYPNPGPPFQYFPRPGVSWEVDTPIHAVLGAGLNLDLSPKDFVKRLPDVPIYPPNEIVLRSKLTLGTGVHWAYGANLFRDKIVEAINAKLPAEDQLESEDFGRNATPLSGDILADGQHFQAPDVTHDLGHGTRIAPGVQGELEGSIGLSSFAALTFSAGVGVTFEVDVKGQAGVLDLRKSVVDQLPEDGAGEEAQCNPIVEETLRTYCSNEFLVGPPCGAEIACETHDDCFLSQRCEEGVCTPGCIQEGTGSAPVEIPSTALYSCEGEENQCESLGTCLSQFGAILARDVTREECEGTLITPDSAGECIAQPPADTCSCSNGLCTGPEEFVVMAPPGAICDGVIHQDAQAYYDAQMAQAQSQAEVLGTRADCLTRGYCYGWVVAEELEWTPFPYVAAVLPGVFTAGENCPYSALANGGTMPVSGTGEPMQSQFVPFRWEILPQPVGLEGLGGEWVSYSCRTLTQTETVGWEGEACDPIVTGYPSVCGCMDDSNCAGTCEEGRCSEGLEQTCACIPEDGGICPQGRTCRFGSCVLDCETDEDCGPGRVCLQDSCFSSNPDRHFAESLVYAQRNTEAPNYTIASYARDELTTSLELDASIGLGMKLDLFWDTYRFSIFKWGDNFPLAGPHSYPHFEMGIRGDYEDDCSDALSHFENRQKRVTRVPDPQDGPSGIPDGAPVSEFLAWCFPEMKKDAEPDKEAPRTPGDWVGGGLNQMHTFGEDLGLYFWGDHQLCIDGKTWDVYFSTVAADPDQLWPLFKCAYEGDDGLHEFDCTSPENMMAGILLATGCMDLSSDFNSQKYHLEQVLKNVGWLEIMNGNEDAFGQMTTTYERTVDGVAVGEPKTVFDPSKVFVMLDASPMFPSDGSNFSQLIQAYNGKSYNLDEDWGFSQWFNMHRFEIELKECFKPMGPDNWGGFDATDLSIELDLGDLIGVCDPCELPDADPEKCLKPAMGPCCIPGGGCLQLTQQDCLKKFGGWYSSGTCQPGACPDSFGACCLPEGLCESSSKDACNVLGGLFNPSGDCSTPMVCGEPNAACCLSGGVCGDVKESACSDAGGLFYPGLSCDDSGVCGTPDFPFGDPQTHACCTANGCFNLTTSQCQEAGGQQTLNKQCNPNLCPDTSVPQLITCCVKGECQSITEQSCLTNGGSVLPGEGCGDVDPCLPPPSEGGCCWGPGQCSIVTQAVCETGGGNWHEGDSCAMMNECLPAEGACCTHLNCEMATAAQCAAQDGVFSEGLVCQQVTCKPPACEGLLNGLCPDVEYNLECNPLTCPGNAMVRDDDCDGTVDSCELCPLGMVAMDKDEDGCTDTCACCESLECAEGFTGTDTTGDGCEDTCLEDKDLCDSGFMAGCPGLDYEGVVSANCAPHEIADDTDCNEKLDNCVPCPEGTGPVDLDGDFYPDACDCCPPEPECQAGWSPFDTSGNGCRDACLEWGGCCEVSGGPGCADLSCEQCVCDEDATCCDVAWDTDCVLLGSSTCLQECSCCEPVSCYLGNAPSDTTGDGCLDSCEQGPCCAILEEPGCQAPACEDAVCQEMPECCDVAWDEDCVELGAGEFVEVCGCIPESGSCLGQCGTYFGAGNCQCDSQCSTYEDCCPDYDAYCTPPAPDSCEDACGGLSADGSCCCQSLCGLTGDVPTCTDFNDFCEFQIPGDETSVISGPESDCDPATGFLCLEGNYCNPLEALCDGIADCPSAEDESVEQCGLSEEGGSEEGGDEVGSEISGQQGGGEGGLVDPLSCLDLCGVPLTEGKCGCDSDCVDKDNCCPDYGLECLGVEPEKSCNGVCGGWAFGGGCNCKEGCLKKGECCPDYEVWCVEEEPCCQPEVKGVCPILGDVTMAMSDPNVVSVQCMILSSLAELAGETAPNCLSAASDLNCDGLTNVTDVVLSIQLALGFPVSSELDVDGNLCPDKCDGLQN